MYFSQKDKQRNLNQFYGFSLRVLRNELIDVAKENQVQLDREASLTGMTLELSAAPDRYFMEDNCIHICGLCIELDNVDLVRAIRSLEHRQQAIITLYYVMDLSDNSVAEILKLHPKSVQRARVKTLKKLRTYLEEKNYGNSKTNIL